MTWSPDQPMVSIKNVHKAFGDLEVLKGVSLDIMKGEVICIIGPSGSGKSTLLNIIGMLDLADEGSYVLDGVPIKNLSENLIRLQYETLTLKTDRYL